MSVKAKGPFDGPTFPMIVINFSAEIWRMHNINTRHWLFLETSDNKGKQTSIPIFVLVIWEHFEKVLSTVVRESVGLGQR